MWRAARSGEVANVKEAAAIRGLRPGVDDGLALMVLSTCAQHPARGNRCRLGCRQARSCGGRSLPAPDDRPRSRSEVWFCRVHRWTASRSCGADAVATSRSPHPIRRSGGTTGVRHIRRAPTTNGCASKQHRETDVTHDIWDRIRYARDAALDAERTERRPPRRGRQRRSAAGRLRASGHPSSRPRGSRRHPRRDVRSRPDGRLINRHDVVIVGGGQAGVSLAARLRRDGFSDIALIDPRQTHRYRPLLSYVGGGQADTRELERPQAEVIPSGVTWYRDEVAVVDPGRPPGRDRGRSAHRGRGPGAVPRGDPGLGRRARAATRRCTPPTAHPTTSTSGRRTPGS